MPEFSLVAPAPSLHPKVQRFVDEGRLWRAREYLASRISGEDFDPALCHQLGWVLLQMRDDLGAGRYLFASGERHAAYRPAIELFLNRNRRGGWQHLASLLPARFRLVPVDSLPAALREDLAALGMTSPWPSKPLAITAPWPPALKLGCAAATLLGVAGCAFAVACLIAGLPIVLDWLYSR